MLRIVTNIRPEIAHLATPVDQMQPWPGNPRRGDVAGLADRLTEYGQYQPIIVQKSTGFIVVGNNRFEAATQKLGWTQIAAVFLDLDDVTARKMLAADNRSSDQATYDDKALAEFLGTLPDLDGTGWTFDDFDDLLASIAAEGQEAMPGDDAPPPWTPSGPLAGPVPTVLPSVPSTDARYAETPEQEQARREQIATQIPRTANGLVEMILVYTEEDRAEVARLVADCREVLGDVKAADVVLRALRVLIALLDNRDDPTPLPISALLKHAGLTG